MEQTMSSDSSVDIKPSRTAGTTGTAQSRPKVPENLTLTPAVFEQLYLAPRTNVSGELRQTYGNPTPLALGGFVVCTTPIAMAMLGWRGAGGFFTAAQVGSYFGFGGLLLLLGAIGEWILGNTFPATVFGTFSGFFLTFGLTVVPDMGAFSAYSTTENPADGMSSPQFYATFAYFFVSMAMLNSVYLVASLRTNVAFMSIFLCLVPCCSCLAAAFFAVADGKPARAETLQHAGASLLFVVSLLGWYIFCSQTLASVEFPICLPMGDLSTIIPGIRQCIAAGKVKFPGQEDAEEAV